MADRNALRRRATILADERYGPAYVRLAPAAVAVVDSAIEAGDGRRARALILEFDAARREKQRTRRRESLRSKVFQHIIDLFSGRANEETVAQGVAMMTDKELRETLQMNSYDLARRAAAGSVRPDVTGVPRSPWWYH